MPHCDGGQFLARIPLLLPLYCGQEMSRGQNDTLLSAAVSILPTLIYKHLQMRCMIKKHIVYSLPITTISSS